MIRELKKDAKQFISDTGYVKGTNYTTSQVSSLMARFAADVVNKNGLSPDVSQQRELLFAFCTYLEETTNIKPFIYKDRIVNGYFKGK